jgi:hypothetical protein
LKPEPETASLDGTCENIKRDRQRCRVTAAEGSRNCFFHRCKKVRKAVQLGIISDLRHALRLSRTSGVPIGQFVSDEDYPG